jgi:hypothetical protein
MNFIFIFILVQFSILTYKGRCYEEKFKKNQYFQGTVRILICVRKSFYKNKIFEVDYEKEQRKKSGTMQFYTYRALGCNIYHSDSRFYVAARFKPGPGDRKTGILCQ